MRFRREYPGLDGRVSSKYIAEYIGVGPGEPESTAQSCGKRETEHATVPDEM